MSNSRQRWKQTLLKQIGWAEIRLGIVTKATTMMKIEGGTTVMTEDVVMIAMTGDVTTVAMTETGTTLTTMDIMGLQTANVNTDDVDDIATGAKTTEASMTNPIQMTATAVAVDHPGAETAACLPTKRLICLHASMIEGTRDRNVGKILLPIRSRICSVVKAWLVGCSSV